jgi:hypothetical protein
MQNGIHYSSALPVPGSLPWETMAAPSPGGKAAGNCSGASETDEPPEPLNDAVVLDPSAAPGKENDGCEPVTAKAAQEINSRLPECPEGGASPLFLVDALPPEPGATKPEEPDTTARRAVIRSLLDGGLSEKESAVFEDALSALSMENLTLLAEHQVKFYVRSIKDMPRKHGIRDFMQKYHYQAVDKTAKAFYNATGATGKPVDEMRYNEKMSYIRKMVELTGARLNSGSSDFGEWMGIDSSRLSRLENITMLPGAFIENKSFKGAFFVRDCLKKSVILHEAAHALDFIKNPAGEQVRACVESHRDSPQFNSMKDKGLLSHYRWFLEECGRSPSARWSTYAAAKGDVREYVAEAVRTYLEAPEKLRKADKEMYLFTRAFLSSPSYPSHAFVTAAQ